MMNHHWTETLKMPSSEALKSLWVTIGKTFQRSIIDNINEQESPWRILQPPTGSGKTQGTIVYAVMQAKLNQQHQGQLKPVGLMVVTRRIDEAELLVTNINKMAGRPVAIALHSKSNTYGDIHDHDVLVITHQGFVNALQRDDEASKRLTDWKGGKRLLTIVDEALANTIESNKVTYERLSQVLGCVPLKTRRDFLEQVKALEHLRDMLIEYTSTEPEATAADDDDAEHRSNSARLLWRESSGVEVSLEPLRRAMRSIRYDHLSGVTDGVLHRRMAESVDETLKDAQGILERWAYYAKRGNEHSFNSSEFLIPLDVPGPVVLDATASQNFLYDLFEDQVTIIPTPGGARRYANVTLHVARASGVGKHRMGDTFSTRYPRLLEALEVELGPERSVFMCLHKDNAAKAESFPTHFALRGIGHWGAIDGANTWKDYDTAVIFGLPYRDNIWATNIFFALQGVQSDDWLRDPRWKRHKDVRNVMQQRQLSASIIQAINRIRCRTVINEHGDSPQADIFIVLPKDQDGDAILESIVAEMPGLHVVSWAFELDGPKVKRPREGSSHASVIAFMKNRLPGATALPLLQRELGITSGAMKKLRETLRDASHATTAALRELGVSYVVEGAGRGAKSFLVKSTPD